MSLTQQNRGMFNELYNRVEGLRAGKPGVGKVFWVNGFSGSDTLWDGFRPTTDVHGDGPLKTIEEALSRCTALEDDYILVLRGGAEDHPIAVNVRRVHIIGITNIGTPQAFPGYLSGAHSCITVNEEHVEIAGLQLLSDDSHPAIELLGTCWGLWVHHCSFGLTAPVQDGILSAVESPVGGLIENNIFGEQIARDGCRLAQATHCVFRNNLFLYNAAGIGLNLGRFAEIFGNRFVARNDQGCAITVGGTNGIVAHNWAAYLKDVDGAAATPYEDTGTNHWSENYVNNVLTVLPA